ncbi:MAG TPA: HesA/MoeB/ThiF family protein [Anaerolineales bacterium]|nr:HesA/MoeB/ThiF family protein [Anaerolineae bacterium]HIP88022.1 HesA/MoeB/ThiF family protein [Anaerolineales bacterium]
MLTPDQRERFARQLVLEGIGEKGQERLAASRVLVVGAGGLGSAACFYLAAAGVGTLGVVDADVVALSNLNRQILHATADLGRPKTESAAETLRALNPDLTVIRRPERLTPARAEALAAEYSLVVECSDNFETKFLVNEACVKAGVPLVWASVLAWEGQMSVVLPGRGPCYRCLFPPTPDLSGAPTAAEVGILGAVAGTMGALEAVEAVKVLLGIGRPLVGRLLAWDGLTGTFDIVAFERQPGCPVCG